MRGTSEGPGGGTVGCPFAGPYGVPIGVPFAVPRSSGRVDAMGSPRAAVLAMSRDDIYSVLDGGIRCWPLVMVLRLW